MGAVGGGGGARVGRRPLPLENKKKFVGYIGGLFATFSSYEGLFATFFLIFVGLFTM